ncbi:hypothetical protein MCOR30_002883 [Pyricularia oryzae]|nr:hypothetical protein MCOR30_002883 [Pyricularia oryzae]
MVHFGIVGSGNSVIKSSEDRSVLVTPDGLIGFEMEGSGMWDNLPYIIIKGPLKAMKAGPWHSQLYKNRNFVGRTELINDLTGKRFLGNNHAHQRIALSGLGGVGKTQLALEIAFWVKDNMPGWSVFWI